MINVKFGIKAGCDCLQIFVKNASQWVGKPIPDGDAREFASERKRTGIRPIVAHASYLINLASPDKALWKKSVDAMVVELQRADRCDDFPFEWLGRLG